MDPIVIVNWGPYKHGPTVSRGYKTDEQCAFCGTMCASNSSLCSDRYHRIRGKWHTAHPPEASDTIALCDMCFDMHKLGDLGTSPNMILFLDGHNAHVFMIYCNFRVND